MYIVGLAGAVWRVLIYQERKRRNALFQVYDWCSRCNRKQPAVNGNILKLTCSYSVLLVSLDQMCKPTKKARSSITIDVLINMLAVTIFNKKCCYMHTS